MALSNNDWPTVTTLIFNLPPRANSQNRIHLPQAIYRLSHGESGNQCIYHPAIDRKHPHPDIVPLQDLEDAITAYAQMESIDFDDGEVIRRHLLQRCFHKPWSTFISCSDSAVETQRRIAEWYKKGCRLITIIKLHTRGMIPAILRRSEGRDLLVWVSDAARPENGQPITLDQFLEMDPRPEMFISMSQLYNDKPWDDWWFRTSYQEDEWLIAHAMPKSRILEVWACYGTKLILNDQTNYPVVTGDLRGHQYWWDRNATVWRDSLDRPVPQGNLPVMFPLGPIWFEEEEKNGNRGGAWFQRRSWRKRKSNPEWEDDQDMTRPRKKALPESEHNRVLKDLNKSRRRAAIAEQGGYWGAQAPPSVYKRLRLRLEGKEEPKPKRYIKRKPRNGDIESEQDETEAQNDSEPEVHVEEDLEKRPQPGLLDASEEAASGESSEESMGKHGQVCEKDPAR